ncbi:hypothetical protein [Caudoviricetes sp.]|nr:hypothetical protein [Caudoviricetes sp.]
MVQRCVSIAEHFVVWTQLAQATPLNHIRVQEQDRGVVRTSLVHHPAVIDLIGVVEVTFVSTNRVALVSRVETVDRTALRNVVRDGGTQRGRNNHVGDLGVETLFSNSHELFVQHGAESLQSLTSSEREVTQTSVCQRTVERRVGRSGRGRVVAVRSSQVQHSSAAGRVTRASASESKQRTKTATVVRRRTLGSSLAGILDRSTVSTQHLQFNVKHDLSQLLDFLICLGIATSLFHSAGSASSTNHGRENLGVVAQVRTGVGSSSRCINSSAFQLGVQSGGTEIVVWPNVQSRVDFALFGHSHVGDGSTVFNVVRDGHVEVFDHDVGGVRAVTVAECGRSDSCHLNSPES